MLVQCIHWKSKRFHNIGTKFVFAERFAWDALFLILKIKISRQIFFFGLFSNFFLLKIAEQQQFS